jgi:dTMP kinase
MFGKLITFEGQDGAGKSTHIPLVKDLIEKKFGVEVIVTREPGGTPVSEKLREIMIHDKMHVETEALIMAASRREHIHQVIEPALREGKWVISDRYIDSSYAYQCGGHGLSVSKMNVLVQWSTSTLMWPNGLLPDLTLMFTVSAEQARQRMSGRAFDKFEQEDLAFFQRVDNAYRMRFNSDPTRFRLVNSNYFPEQVADVLKQAIENWNPE